jgi:hypothetical protein
MCGMTSAYSQDPGHLPGSRAIFAVLPHALSPGAGSLALSYCRAGLAVVGEGDVSRALVHGELELPVLGQLLAAAVVHPSRVRVLSVPERLLDLLAVDPVAQRPGVGAAVRVAVRMLTGG